MLSVLNWHLGPRHLPFAITELPCAIPISIFIVILLVGFPPWYQDFPNLYARSNRLTVRSHHFTVKNARFNRKFYAEHFYSRFSQLWKFLTASCLLFEIHFQNFKYDVNRLFCIYKTCSFLFSRHDNTFLFLVFIPIQEPLASLWYYCLAWFKRIKKMCEDEHGMKKSSVFETVKSFKKERDDLHDTNIEKAKTQRRSQ